jgi:hypothetical protein
MEARFQKLLANFSESTQSITHPLPVLIVSTHQLTGKEIGALKQGVLEALRPSTQFVPISSIFSMKMMHIYFNTPLGVLDYRPHRGLLSRLVVSDYRVPNTDRVEPILILKRQEWERLKLYADYILRDPSTVLGEAHPISIRDPDFAVHSTRTEGMIHQNRFLDPGVKHNCLTWLTLAPIGQSGGPLMDLFRCAQRPLSPQTHSYIVDFYHHLVFGASHERVGGLIYWTQKKLKSAISEVYENPNFLTEFYGSKGTETPPPPPSMELPISQ